MEWEKLLSSKRVRGLYGFSSSAKADGDLRSQYERDYGRSVFSTPVRRLQDKAQVFPLEEHDAVRTRLTHSMEVSSVARGLGSAAEKFVLNRGLSADFAGAIPTIAATCGLIHDLGNPPFGHAGEEAISDWFLTQFKKDPALFKSFDPKDDRTKPEETQFAKDFLKFEGNAQTQRLLSRLQVLADDFGLNLTSATLSASCKYTASSHGTNSQDQARKKHGYFASENDLIRRLREEVGTGDARNPITYLVEASDDIVYSTVDLEDGIKKGCLDWEFLKKELGRYCDSEILGQVIEVSEKKISEAALVGRAYDEAMASAFRTNAITQMVIAVDEAFQVDFDKIMLGEYPYELLYKSRAGSLAKACKKVALEHIYKSNEVLKREIMGRRVICDLMDLYWDGVQEFETEKSLKGFKSKIFSQISSNYRHVFLDNLQKADELKIPRDYFKMQLITDQISGMTDTFAVNLHRELMNG
jgi:dGTPase